MEGAVGGGLLGFRAKASLVGAARAVNLRLGSGRWPPEASAAGSPWPDGSGSCSGAAPSLPDIQPGPLRAERVGGRRGAGLESGQRRAGGAGHQVCFRVLCALCLIVVIAK